MTRLPLLLFVALIASPGIAEAQTASTSPVADAAPSSADTVSLTDAEREAILDGNTLDSAAAIRGEMAGSDRTALEVHGEVGVMIGSHGTRAVYGTAAIPLGDHAAAVVSFESSRFDYRR